MILKKDAIEGRTAVACKGLAIKSILVKRFSYKCYFHEENMGSHNQGNSGGWPGD